MPHFAKSGGGAEVGGSDTQIQYNDSGALGGDADLSYDADNSILTGGKGSGGQITLSANLDQDDVLIKRDVDGASTYSEAGSLLALQRDVTNATSEGGSFLECLDAAGGVLVRIDNAGQAAFSEQAAFSDGIGICGHPGPLGANVEIGAGSYAKSRGVSVGTDAYGNSYTVAVGQDANAGQSGTAVGYQTNVDRASTALGEHSGMAADNCVCLGFYAGNGIQANSLFVGHTESDMTRNLIHGRFDLKQITFGRGHYTQDTLAANLDQQDVLFRRDVDGATSTYSEAGPVVAIQRSVANVSSEDGDFLMAQSADGLTDLSGIMKGGYFVTELHSAPADADLDAGQCAMWFDETDGAGKFEIKAKTTNGTVVTGTVALT